MLTCQQVNERATALLEGELSLRSRMATRMHLAMCVHCRRFNRQFRSLVESLKHRNRADPVNDDFIERVVKATDKALEDGPLRETGA